MQNPFMDKFMRVVKKEMDRYGCDVTIIRDISSESDYDPVTGTTPQNIEEYPCRGILFDLTLQSNGDGYKHNTLISQGDKQLFIQPPEDDGWYQDNEATTIIPNKDSIRIGDKLYKVITFKQINPSTQDSVLFECYVRE